MLASRPLGKPTRITWKARRRLGMLDVGFLFLAASPPTVTITLHFQIQRNGAGDLRIAALRFPGHRDSPMTPFSALTQPSSAIAWTKAGQSHPEPQPTVYRAQDSDGWQCCCLLPPHAARRPFLPPAAQKVKKIHSRPIMMGSHAGTPPSPHQQKKKKDDGGARTNGFECPPYSPRVPKRPITQPE